MKFEIDTDIMERTLKENEPLSMGMIEYDNTKEPKLVCLFALPHLADKIQAFAEEMLKEYNNETNRLEG